MLNIIVIFGDDFDFWGDKEWRVESDTELSNKIDVTTFKAFKEVSGSRLGYGT